MKSPRFPMNVTYDSRNRVVRRVSPNGTLNLTYSGWNLIEERDASGTLEQTYVHGAGTDELLVKVSSSDLAYYHHDGLGSTIALTGENGELLESYRYDAFGAVSVYDSSGSALPASPRGNRFLFTGRVWLGQAGIYDYRNRVYSASLGRFLQTDPIRFAAGDVNLYRYVGNNPVNLVDPTGLWGIGWINSSGQVAFNIGVGNPTLAFSDESGMELSKGAAATLDGIIPFADPLEFAYANDDGSVDCEYQASRKLAGFSRDIYLGSKIPNLGAWAKNPLMYEAGQTTVPRGVAAALERLDPITRGKMLVEANGGGVAGYAKTVFGTAWGQSANTIGTGLTPGGNLLILGGASAADAASH